MSFQSLSRIGMLPILALVLVLSGCASMKPVPLATEAEVLQRRGEPTRIWDNPDGSRSFEYATQPNGHTAWMYTIDAEGRVLEQYDALAADNLARVKPGMTPAEVTRMLGQHRSVQRFALSGEEVWDWTIANEWPDLVATRFNVHFVDGKVIRTSRSYVYPRENWMFGFGVGRSPYWGFGWGWPYYRHPYWGW